MGDRDAFALHASNQTGFSTTSLTSIWAAASRDLDFSDAAPSIAAGETGVGTEIGTVPPGVLLTIVPGGRKGVHMGNR